MKRLCWPYVFVYIGYALAVGLAIWLAFDAAWLEIMFVVAAVYATEHMCFALSRMGLYLLNLPYETSPEHLGHALVTDSVFSRWQLWQFISWR